VAQRGHTAGALGESQRCILVGDQFSECPLGMAQRVLDANAPQIDPEGRVLIAMPRIWSAASVPAIRPKSTVRRRPLRVLSGAEHQSQAR